MKDNSVIIADNFGRCKPGMVIMGDLGNNMRKAKDL